MSDVSPWGDLARPPLRAAALRRALVDGLGPWTSIEVLTSTGSTNADLAARAVSGAAVHGAVLVADYQVAGRGRRERTWTAPPRSALAVSMLVVPGTVIDTVPQARWSWLPLLVGVGVVEALTDVAGVQAALKWPNDVLLDVDGSWGKVCGVLAQVVSTPAGEGVVVGLGLNVNQRADELPVPTASSLLTAAATTTDRDIVLRAVLRSVGRWVQTWQRHEGDPVASGLGPAYRRVCRTIGRDVRVQLPDGVVLEGLASAVRDDGRLLVEPADGSPARPLAAGDVVHVR